MQNSMEMFNLSVINGKNLFSSNSLQIFKFVNLTWNLVLRPMEICRIQWGCSIFLLSTGTPFSGKFGPNIQICQFHLKFSAKTNSNMQNSMGMFTFSLFNGKHVFWAFLVQKIKIVYFTLNLVLRLIQICRILWGYSLFLFSTGNTLFGQIWSKKSKFSM